MLEPESMRPIQSAAELEELWQELTTLTDGAAMQLSDRELRAMKNMFVAGFSAAMADIALRAFLLGEPTIGQFVVQASEQTHAAVTGWTGAELGMRK